MRETDFYTINKKLGSIKSDLGISIDVRIPKRSSVSAFVDSTLSLLFPCLKDEEGDEISVERIYAMLRFLLDDAVDSDLAEKIANDFVLNLPSLGALLIKDAYAIYGGDPAATSPLEVMICYPGFFAIAVQRIAHLLYSKGIPMIPRIMTEYAHGKTGIDIHPGARIGESFCIDHGTGVVVGETAEIGRNVKIYQGVTIGAKSFEKDGEGRPVKGKKRHPTIGNNCTIYAGATILGGDTIIGDGCVIGGNVWLTHSLLPNEKIYFNNKK